MQTENKKIWTIKDYQIFQKELEGLADDKYRTFHQKLTSTKYKILGINVPTCRKIAKKIAKTDIESFLKYNSDHYYEAVLIEGFVIASIKDEQKWQQEFPKFLPKIDNWAICDCFCNSIEIVKYNKEKYFDYFQNLLKSKEPFTIRVGLITLLSFYITKEYLEIIFNSLDNIKSDHYYVNMGMAWLLAEMYTKFPEETEEYLKRTQVNDFTINKTISKIRDSFRVSKEKKEELLKYKRRKDKI